MMHFMKCDRGDLEGYIINIIWGLGMKTKRQAKLALTEGGLDRSTNPIGRIPLGTDSVRQSKEAEEGKQEEEVIL